MNEAKRNEEELNTSDMLSHDPSVRGGYKAGWIGVPRENCPTKVESKRTLWVRGWLEGRKVLDRDNELRKVLDRDNELRKKYGINF